MNPVVVNPVLRGIPGRDQRVQHSRVCSWGWFHTLVHIFHAFLYFEEKTYWLELWKIWNISMEKHGQQLLMRANQRKSDFMNIYYIYPIHWLITFMQELINPTGLLAAAPGDHFSPLCHHHP